MSNKDLHTPGHLAVAFMGHWHYKRGAFALTCALYERCTTFLKFWSLWVTLMAALSVGHQMCVSNVEHRTCRTSNVELIVAEI